MTTMTCPTDGKDLNLDFEETKKNGVLPVYSCIECGRGYILKLVVEKPLGFKTQRKMNRDKFIKSIPF